MPRRVRSFLAPLFFEAGENDEAGEHRGRNYRSVGLTSMMPMRGFPAGMRCLYPPGVPIEVVHDGTPDEWERLVLWEVPNGVADRTRIYAWLTVRGGTKFVGPDEVALVLPEWDPAVRPNYRRIEVAKIPPEFWAQFGPDYGGELVGEFFPEGYRVTCEFQGEFADAAPTSWVEYRPDLGGKTPYPMEDIKQLSESDKARHRRRAEERASQLLGRR